MPLIHCTRCGCLTPLLRERDTRRYCSGCRLLAIIRDAVLDGSFSDFPIPLDDIQPGKLPIATNGQPLRVTYRDLLGVPSRQPAALVQFDDLVRPYFIECERGGYGRGQWGDWSA